MLQQPSNFSSTRNFWRKVISRFSYQGTSANQCVTIFTLVSENLIIYSTFLAERSSFAHQPLLPDTLVSKRHWKSLHWLLTEWPHCHMDFLRGNLQVEQCSVQMLFNLLKCYFSLNVPYSPMEGWLLLFCFPLAEDKVICLEVCVREANLLLAQSILLKAKSIKTEKVCLGDMLCVCDG